MFKKLKEKKRTTFEYIKKVTYFLIIPILIIGVLIFLLKNYFNCLEKEISQSATIIQSLAILIGGLWAYQKFDWSKKAESAIKIKAMLMEYEQMHKTYAIKYRQDEIAKKDPAECWINYVQGMVKPRNVFTSQIQLSCYLPKKLRNRILEIIFLPLNKGISPKNEDLDKNWEAFSKEMVNIKNALDNIVSK